MGPSESSHVRLETRLFSGALSFDGTSFFSLRTLIGGSDPIRSDPIRSDPMRCDAMRCGAVRLCFEWMGSNESERAEAEGGGRSSDCEGVARQAEHVLVDAAVLQASRCVPFIRAP